MSGVKRLLQRAGLLKPKYEWHTEELRPKFAQASYFLPGDVIKVPATGECFILNEQLEMRKRFVRLHTHWHEYVEEWDNDAEDFLLRVVAHRLAIPYHVVTCVGPTDSVLCVGAAYAEGDANVGS